MNFNEAWFEPGGGDVHNAELLLLEGLTPRVDLVGPRGLGGSAVPVGPRWTKELLSQPTRFRPTEQCDVFPYGRMHVYHQLLIY